MINPNIINQNFPVDPATTWTFKGEGTVACVLIHGFTGLPSEMRPIGKLLMDLNISHESILLPGHGSSIEKMAENEWEDWYNIALNAVLDLRKKNKTVIAIGFSMGGTIALKLASAGLVDGVCSLAGLILQPDKRIFLAKYMALFKVVRIKKVDPDPYKYLVPDEFLGYSRHAYYAIYQLHLLLKKVRKSLYNINVPVLLVHSKQDRVVPYKNMNYIREAVTSDSIRCVTLEKSNHVITWDVETEIILEELSEFLIKFKD